MSAGRRIAAFAAALLACAALAAAAAANAAAPAQTVGVAHVLATGNGLLAAGASTVSPAELGRLWQSAADNDASHLVIAMEGAPLQGALGQIAADAKATFAIASTKSSSAIALNEMFTATEASPVARRSNAGTVVLTTNTYESASLHDLVAAATQGQGRVLSVASTADTLAVSTIHPETAAAHPLWTADAVLLGDQVRPAQTAKLRAPVSFESTPRGLTLARIAWEPSPAAHGMAQSATDASALASRIHAAVGELAPQAAAQLRDGAGAPLFSMEVRADAMFLREVAALKALNSELSQTGKAVRSTGASAASLVTVVLSSLSELRAVYGEDSPQYQTAWAQLNALVPEVASTFAATASSAPVVTVVSLAHSAAAAAPAEAHAPSRSGVRTRSVGALPPSINRASGPVALVTCYDTQADCNNATTSCSNRGTCSRSTVQNVDCWTCTCNYSYTGATCVYYDISSIFWIMVFLAVFLIVSVFITSVTVANIDPGTGTLLFKTAASGRSKTE